MKIVWNSFFAGPLRTAEIGLAALCLPACVFSAQTSRSITQLEFVRSGGTGLLLKLSNHSDQVISLRGTRGPSVADPWDTLVECKAADSADWREEPFGLVDGEAQEIEVLPGKSILLEVSNDFANKYKGGLCHVSIRLTDGKFVKSNDFRP
jgi:hypothetical protein